jgi:hypothetical protein
MEQPKLGNLNKIDLRKIWPNEAANFTPWLAIKENLAQLGIAVGMELEVEHTEVACGPFSADIVARELSSDGYVVIENQLGKTDHDHLGKALTYAALVGAKTVIWVAGDFTDEHRKTLDWLNDHVGEDLSLFGVQVELWSIEGSAPAVRFNVISRPTELVKQATAAKTGELSDNRKLQLEWWTAFRDALTKKKAVPSAQSPRPQYWYNIALGKAGAHLSATANTYDKQIGVRVYLSSKVGGATALKQLMESREQIEEEIGSPLAWDPNPGATDKVIVLTRSADLTQKGKWQEYLDWMVETTIKFRNAFGPRVKDLALQEDPSSGEAAET